VISCQFANTVNDTTTFGSFKMPLFNTSASFHLPCQQYVVTREGYSAPSSLLLSSITSTCDFSASFHLPAAYILQPGVKLSCAQGQVLFAVMGNKLDGEFELPKRIRWANSYNREQEYQF
jgi:hypothetical protein